MGAAVARVALEGAARSREVEAGGVTRDSNAHLTASLSLSTRWSREKSRAALRGHQGSYVHDASLLIDAREWSRKRTEEEFRALLQRERRQGLELGLGRDGNAGTTRS